MKVRLYQSVALVRDIDEHRLKQGDVAVLIDRVPYPSGGEEGVILAPALSGRKRGRSSY